MLLLNRSDPFWLQYTFPYRYPANVVVVAVVVPLPRGVRWLLGCLLAPILLPPPLPLGRRSVDRPCRVMTLSLFID